MGNGQKQICYLKSNDARMFQHECEHLDGRLMTDSITWNGQQDDSAIIYLDEFLRRQEILKPQIESLIAQFNPAQQNELYKVYDPMHPPCDEELVQILERILEQVEEQKQQLVEQAIDEQNVR